MTTAWMHHLVHLMQEDDGNLSATVKKDTRTRTYERINRARCCPQWPKCEVTRFKRFTEHEPSFKVSSRCIYW